MGTGRKLARFTRIKHPLLELHAPIIDRDINVRAPISAQHIAKWSDANKDRDLL